MDGGKQIVKSVDYVYLYALFSRRSKIHIMSIYLLF